jgi:hypothetical protein
VMFLTSFFVSLMWFLNFSLARTISFRRYTVSTQTASSTTPGH